MEPIRLTQFSHGGGCGCKLGPGDLKQIVTGVPRWIDPKLLVGLETSDDAAVIELTPDLAIIHTTDFFMPIVDDPFDFGRIAAANALSDVYAMGGEPLSALALLGFPRDRMPLEAAAEIVRGGGEMCREAGIQITGGHSIDDAEPKFGLAVLGTVHPRQIWKNSNARPGDVLVLTKPIGIGALSSALKKGEISDEHTANLVRTMTFLNRAPARAGRRIGVQACTDVTGFSLIGHLLGMARGAGIGAEIWFDRVPVLPGARETIAKGITPGGTRRNLEHYTPEITWDGSFSDADKKLLADPQTSGGLLFAVAPDRERALVEALQQEAALAHAVVGRFVGGAGLRVTRAP